MQRQIDIQDLLWQNISALPYFRGFLRAIEGKYFQDLQIEGEILDLGCGDGHFSATTFPNSVIKGIDPSFYSLGLAKHTNYYSGLICSSGDHLPFANASFKTIISNSVLEHIPDVDSVVEEVMRVLKPSGKLFITVPNSNFTQNLSIARLFDRMQLKGFAKGYRKFFNWISRHYHPDPSNVWLDRLIKKNLTILKTWNYFPPNYFKILEWGHYFGFPSWIYKKLLGRWVINPNKNNYFIKKDLFLVVPLFFRGIAKSKRCLYIYYC